jgi:hypothetical protein
VGTEPLFCDALRAYLEAATNRNAICFLVAIYMAAFRVVTEQWLEHEAEGNLVAPLRERLCLCICAAARRTHASDRTVAVAVGPPGQAGAVWRRTTPAYTP